MSGFLQKWYQWEAFMERKKIVASIFPLATTWWWIEVTRARRREKILEWSQILFQKPKVARKGKVKKTSLYIESGDGSHHLTNLWGLKHGFPGLG